MKSYRSAVVLGLGESGRAAAELLLSEGTNVTVVDAAGGGEVARRARRLRSMGCRVVLSAGSVPSGTYDVCVASPGISSSSDWVKELRLRGVEVIPEIDLGADRCRCRILAVTGSNGKSTLVKLCGESLGIAGRRVAMGGNFGEPLSDMARRSRKLDWVVAEVSSFQLEAAKSFRPAVGVLLNLEPNHLDRHGTMRAYVAAKSNLFRRMRRGCSAVVPAGAARRMRLMSRGTGRWILFGRRRGVDVRSVRHGVVDSRGRVLSFKGTYFDNPVYGLSAAAAVAAMEACGVDPLCVSVAAGRFKPLDHRMTPVAEIGGVKFVDDSKSTNLGAMCAALEMCDGPVRLIAGGLLKEHDLGHVKNTIAKRVRRIYVIGKAALSMEKAWGRVVGCRKCRDIGRAVMAAWRDSERGETILLSPGCASFDQFSGYEDRGNKFRKSVKLISKEMV